MSEPQTLIEAVRHFSDLQERKKRSHRIALSFNRSPGVSNG